MTPPNDNAVRQGRIVRTMPYILGISTILAAIGLLFLAGVL